MTNDERTLGCTYGWYATGGWWVSPREAAMLPRCALERGHDGEHALSELNALRNSYQGKVVGPEGQTMKEQSEA